MSIVPRDTYLPAELMCDFDSGRAYGMGTITGRESRIQSEMNGRTCAGYVQSHS